MALAPLPKNVSFPTKVPLSTNGSRRGSSRLLVCHRNQQQGAAVTLTVTVLMVIALLLLSGPLELARVTWLLSPFNALSMAQGHRQVEDPEEHYWSMFWGAPGLNARLQLTEILVLRVW